MEDRDLARWQGATDADIKNLKERTGDLEKALQRVEGLLTAVQIQLSALKTQVGMWSALGGILGAGITTVVVSVLSGGHLG